MNRRKLAIEVTEGALARQDRPLAMELAPLQAERDQRIADETTQTERERDIAEAYETAGIFKGLEFVQKVVTVTGIMRLAQVKETQGYKGIGTWEDYCKYLGLDRHTIDGHIKNLHTFGEQFLVTCDQFGLSYRKMRKLRQLSHTGDVAIIDNTITIGDKTIPVDEDHAEDIQAAIEWILDESKEMNKRLTRLEKDMKGAVKEETHGLLSEKKALLERVKALEIYEPANIDDSRFEEQYQIIHDTINTIACQIAKLVMMEGLHENPLAAAKVEGFIASSERLVEDLRRDWTAKFQIF